MAKQYTWTNADGLTLGGGRNAPDTSTPEINAELSQSELTAVQALVAGAWMQVSAQPGVDCLAAVNTAIAALQARGGGVLHMPYIGGVGYYTSNRIYINSSNITMLLEDNLTYTGTATITAVVHFTGSISPAAYIENPALIAPKRVKIDANARNLVGYVHPTPGSPGTMHGVLFQFCKNVYVQNIYVYNGIAGGITLSYCLSGRMVNPEASDVLYDNGIYIYNNGEHYGLPTADTPATWANIEVINPRAWNCANHGLGIFGAIGTTWVNPKVWGCGNNTPTAPDGFARTAGPAGGIGIEFDLNTDPNALLNYRCTVINPQVTGSYGYAIRTNCIGTKVHGGFVRGPKKPTAYTDSVPAIWGTAVFVQNNATITLQDVEIDGSEQFGIRAQGTATQQPKIWVEGGRISGCVDRALYAINFAEVYVSPSTIFSLNGTIAGGATTLELNNSPNMAGLGICRVSGQYETNGGQVANANSVGAVHFQGVRGHNNNNGLASANHVMEVSGAATTLIASDILLTSTNAKQARVLRGTGTIAKAVLARESILGDQTNTTAPRADVTATVMIADVYATAAPAAAPSYYGQKWYDTTNAKMYFAKGQASAADWIILN